MKRVVFASLLAALYGCSDVGTDSNFESFDTTAPVDDWQLVWSDDFDSDQLDTTKWNYEFGCDISGDNVQNCYSDSAENTYVTDSNLHLIATKQPEDSFKPYNSARVTTKNTVDWKYGRFEIRAKFPYGEGAWATISLVPTDEEYGEGLSSGQINIAEALNLKVDDGEGNLESRINGSLHYGGELTGFETSGQQFAPSDEVNPADDFHTYAVEWQEGEIRWYVDGYLFATQRASELVYDAEGSPVKLLHPGWFAEYIDPETGELATFYNNAPFDQYFHLTMDLSVGGPEGANTSVDETAFAEGQSFVIDYVRVYKCATGPGNGSGCDTLRAGYDQLPTDEYPAPEYALVEGLAPDPVESTGAPRELVVNGTFDGDVSSWNKDADITVVTEDGNSFFFGAVAAAGNPWDVNLSAPMTLIPETDYVLTFDAKASEARTIVAGLGFYHDPWTNATKTVALTTEWQTYTLRITTAGFGDDDSRALFDMGDQLGDVSIDNVSVRRDIEMVVNGTFEGDVSSWNKDADITVVTEDGNTFFYGAVDAAGNPWDVNLSAPLTLVPDTDYVLTFDAKATEARTIVAGLGFYHDPWTNATETVSLTNEWQTFTLRINTAGFGDDDSRALFDMGDQLGDVSIDDISVMALGD